MIGKANDVYNRWLSQEAPIIKHGEELEVAAKAETFSGSAITNGQTTHFGQMAAICHPSSSHTQTLLVPDPFARAHQSLAQCIHDVHERAEVPFPNPSQHHRRCRSSSAAASRSDPVWRSWSPPPRVGSPILSEIVREIDFCKETSPPDGYGRLQTMSSPNRTMPAYFHLTPRSVYGGHEIYGDMYSPFPQDGLRLPFSTLSSTLGGGDPINFDTNEQNWMAFF